MMFNKILVSVDLADESSWRKSLPVAIDACRANEASLCIMTVIPDFGMSIVGQYFPEGYEDTVAEKVLKTLREFVKTHVPEGIPVQHVVGEGTVYESILQTAKKIGADLIIMASHRPELSDFLLGPNAARVVRHADCSVMVVRE